MISAPRFFRTLADRTRLRVVNLLACGPLCVCDLQYVLGQPQSSVSRHLGHLRAAGLVRDRRDGMRTFYELTDWDAGLPGGVLETLRRELRADIEYRRDLETLVALKATAEYHREGSERAPRADGARRTTRPGTTPRAAPTDAARRRASARGAVRAQR